EGDCDDLDPSFHPEAWESCDGDDKNCDGEPSAYVFGDLVSALDVSASAQPLDVDGDGDVDLAWIAAGAFPGAETLWGSEHRGAGSFGADHPVDALPSPFGIHAADLDQDGLTDLVVTSLREHMLAWMKNLGGTFGPATFLADPLPSAHAPVSGDLDQDG